MVTIVVAVLVAVVATGMFFYERFKEQSYVAKVIDGQKLDGRFITPNTENIISMLKEKNLALYVNFISFKDGQKLSRHYDDEKEFKEYSDLNYVPTSFEWSILIGVVKKLYPKL